MKYRDMLRSDLQHVIPLYERMRQEAMEDPEHKAYPAPGNIKDDFAMTMMRVLDPNNPNPNFKGIVAVAGRVTKGFLTAEMMERTVGEPKKFVMGISFYVEPIWRSKGIGQELIRLMYEWAFANGARAIEACYVPGTKAHKLWAQTGFRTYAALGVLVDEQFKPRTNIPELIHAEKKEIA